MVQQDMLYIDHLSTKIDIKDPDSIYCKRELLTTSCDGLRVDLVTITSVYGMSDTRESLISGLFPPSPPPVTSTYTSTSSTSLGRNLSSQPSDEQPILDNIPVNNNNNSTDNKGIISDSSVLSRPHTFPTKEVVFISARVHPGEVPAQHTMKGMLNLLLDPNDLCAKELRRRYVFKIIPLLNPDGKR